MSKIEASDNYQGFGDILSEICRKEYVRLIMSYILKRINFIPSFKGLHNRSKSKAWLMLLEARLAGSKGGLTTNQLSSCIGVSCGSLASLLIHWYRWHYVLCYRDTGVCRWLLATRGKRWLLRHYLSMPLSEYASEMPYSIERAIAWLKENDAQRYEILKIFQPAY